MTLGAIHNEDDISLLKKIAQAPCQEGDKASHSGMAIPRRLLPPHMHICWTTLHRPQDLLRELVLVTQKNLRQARLQICVVGYGASKSRMIVSKLNFVAAG